MLTLASIFSVPSNVGYPALVALILAESAGVPVPGETSLITGAILAASHKLSIELVIILAAASAIVGDNIGYLIGRKGGRYLLERPGPFRRQRAQVLRTGEPFFEKHGPKAVFFGRWILGLRMGGLAGRGHRHAVEKICLLECPGRNQLGHHHRPARLLLGSERQGGDQ